MLIRRTFRLQIRRFFLAGLALLLAGVMGIYILGTHLAQYSTGTQLKIGFDATERPGTSSWALLGHINEYVLQTCCDHSFNRVADPEGNRGEVGKFSLKPSDSRIKGNYRSELRILSNPLKEDTWYKASVFVPSDWKDSEIKVVAMQWHGSRDFFVGEVGRMPPLEITITNDNWQVQKAFDNRLISTADTPGHVESIVPLAELKVEKGVWTDWVIHTRWSPESDGITRIWVNGEKIVEDFGPNAHRDLTGPYLKAGVYAPEWGYTGTEPDITERTLLFDSVEMIQDRDPYGLITTLAKN